MSRKPTKEEFNSRQERALVLLVDNPGITNSELAEECNVSVRTVQRWRTDPVFVKMLVEDAQQYLSSCLPVIYSVAATNAVAGDPRFVKLILDHVEELYRLKKEIVLDKAFVITWKQQDEEQKAIG